ncbi:MAG TPA: methylenetetrahydrofolate reductase [Thermotogota bacterium]|nr:methylenetetrahydrofolate reductase [Thermotogota bacterium]HPJ87601.1 methylenetetrahydrofolate reductase [Thermotogota bacterium]HPR94806.1 methylenetetrahydrofolate reductase [Thermotogota bacterium]
MTGRISDIFQRKGDSVSFEVYPPKKGQKKQFEIIKQTINRLTDLNPDFISVTYGPGGTNKGKAVEISEYIENRHEMGSHEGTVALAHLTAVGYTKKDIGEILDKLYDKGVRNILALRGDIPQNVTFPYGAWCDFEFAKDLISVIKSDGRFCIGAAAYPEGHQDCKDMKISVDHLKVKVEAGADFFITQLFFNNDLYFKFLDQVEDSGMHMPIIPGIMPILRAEQIRKIVSLSGATIPKDLNEKIELYKDKPEEMEKFGIEYAVKQIEELKRNGITRFHLYTMNRWKQVNEIVKLSGLR